MNIRKFLRTYLILWLFLILFTLTDVLVWPKYQSSGYNQFLYLQMWHAELYSFMILSAVTLYSLAVPLSLFLFNYLSVESLFYYLFQGKLPPYSLPWLTIHNSANLYFVSIVFVFLSILLVYDETWFKSLIFKLRNERSVTA